MNSFFKNLKTKKRSINQKQLNSYSQKNVNF